MDLTDTTPAEVKRIVDKQDRRPLEDEDEEKIDLWTAVSICLAFIGFFIVGGAVTIGSLAKALSD